MKDYLDFIRLNSFFIDSIIVNLFFQDYPKLSQTYYVLLECLAQDHMSFLATLEPQVFLYILSSISEGLTALGLYILYYSVFKLLRSFYS